MSVSSHVVSSLVEVDLMVGMLVQGLAYRNFSLELELKLFT